MRSFLDSTDSNPAVLDKMEQMSGQISDIHSLLLRYPDLHGAGITININVSSNDTLVKDNQTLLSLQDIPAWRSNEAVIQAETTFRQIQDKYEALQEKWLGDRHNEIICREYESVSLEYYEAKKRFIKLKRDIFDDLCRAIILSLKEESSERLDLAYKHLAQGEYREANRFLSLGDITSDIDHLYRKRTAIGQTITVLEMAEAHTHNEMYDHLKELIEGANILRRLAKSEREWDEVEQYYDTAMRIIVDFCLPIDTLFEYVEYLEEQRKVTKAIEIIKKIYESLDDISVPEQRAKFFQLAANLHLRDGDKLGEVVNCFKIAFSYWLDLTKEKLNEEQQLHLVSLFMDVGHFWNKTFLNSKQDEDVFANAYALLWETRKVMNNIYDAFGGTITTSKTWLLEMIYKSIISDKKMLDEFKYEENIHRLMNSHELLAVEAYNNAYMVNEPITVSDNENNKYVAYRNRADILCDRGCVYLEFSNHHGKEYLAESLLYLAMAKDDLREISAVDISCKDDFDIESETGRLHLNFSSVFRKLQHYGMNSYEIMDALSGIIALTPVVDGCVDCVLEEEAHLDKGITIFEKLYQSNPTKYRNFLYTCYLMRSEYKDRRGLFGETIDDCKKVIELYEFLPNDIEVNSGVYKAYIESELHIANVYMRREIFTPEKAVPHFEKAMKTCGDLAAKLPEVHDWKLAEIFTETAKAYAATNKFDKAKDLIFNKAHEVLLRLLVADDGSKFGLWDRWLDVIELFFANLHRQTLEGVTDKEMFWC